MLSLGVATGAARSHGVSLCRLTGKLSGREFNKTKLGKCSMGKTWRTHPGIARELTTGAVLFDGDGLGQVARLIDIRALEHCHMIRQQLQWYREDNGCNTVLGG